MGAMGPEPALDVALLIHEARALAIEVAETHRLGLRAQALTGVDQLVKERAPRLQALASQHRFEFETWKGHVLHVCESVASDLKSRGIREVRTESELVEAVRRNFRVYPYDWD